MIKNIILGIILSFFISSIVLADGCNGNCVNGYGTYVWVNFGTYDGEWKNGMQNGQGIMTWSDGNKYDGYTYATGRTYTGEFKHDAMVTAVKSNVRSATGTVFSLNPINAEMPTANTEITDTGAIFTLDDSTTTIERDDGSVVEIKQKSIVLLNPYVQTSNTITLIRGETTLTVDCSVTGAYEVQTTVANIQVSSCNTAQRAGNTTKFTTTYSQSGLNGTMTVSVASGTVDVVDKEGNTFTLNAGEEKTIQAKVSRTSWVLPLDGDKFYGGESNLLIWTEFPNAASYQMEFNLPSPLFAEANVASAEFPKQVIPLLAGSFTKYDGLIIVPLPFPEGADGLMLELRIFVLDASGNIIGESVSSDSTKATVTD